MNLKSLQFLRRDAVVMVMALLMGFMVGLYTYSILPTPADWLTVSVPGNADLTFSSAQLVFGATTLALLVLAWFGRYGALRRILRYLGRSPTLMGFAWFMAGLLAQLLFSRVTRTSPPSTSEPNLAEKSAATDLFLSPDNALNAVLLGIVGLFALAVIMIWNQRRIGDRIGLTLRCYSRNARTNLFDRAREFTQNAQNTIVIVTGPEKSRSRIGLVPDESEKAYYKELVDWAKLPGNRLYRYLQIDVDNCAQDLDNDARVKSRLTEALDPLLLEHLQTLLALKTEAPPDCGGEIYLFVAPTVRRSTFILYDQERLLWSINDRTYTSDGAPSVHEMSSFLVIRDVHGDVFPQFQRAANQIAELAHPLKAAHVSVG